jgi:pimeloyl-ACP methyl ester carboxylesterase
MEEGERPVEMKRLPKSARIIAAALILVVLSGAGGVAWWNSQTYPASDVALQALQSDERVVVTQGAGLITFEPVNLQASIGFILYPGAGVDYRAYAPVLHQIAARGYFTAVVRVPLNLAFFDSNAANRVMELYPAVEHWAVGGHSLGGVTASGHVMNNLNRIAGLVLWASYPADDALATAPLKVLSIYGTNDLAGMEPFDRSRAQLPAGAQFVVIEGGNHAQFGSYGPQRGDHPAAISADEQWTQIAEATAQFLDALNQ